MTHPTPEQPDEDETNRFGEDENIVLEEELNDDSF